MGKTLITVDNLDQFISGGRLRMDSSKILTAGARDELYKRGVDVAYAEAASHCCCASGQESQTRQCHEDVLIGVAAIIKQHYGITDPEVLKKVTLETVTAIGKSLHE